MRDYVYVGDVARTNLASLHGDLPGDETTFINIGTGVGTSVNRLWTSSRPPRAPPSRRRTPARAGDVRHSVLDASRAKRALTWEPEIGLAEGIVRTWAWFARAVTMRT